MAHSSNRRGFRLGLRAWFFITPALALLIFAIVDVILIETARKQSRELYETHSATLERVQSVAALGGDIAEIHLEMLGALERARTVEKADFYDSVRPTMHRLHKVVAELEAARGQGTAGSPAASLTAQLSTEFERLRKQYVRATISVSLDIDRFKSEVRRVNEQYLSVTHQLGLLGSVVFKLNENAAKAIAEHDRELTRTLAVGLLLAALISLLVSWFISLRFSRDLEYAIQALSNLAKGQPSGVRVDRSRNDEIGALGSAISYFESILKRLQHEIAERESSETQYRNLFDNAGDAILVLKDRHYIAMNRQAEEMFGVSAEDAIGKPLGSLSGHVRESSEATARLLNEVFDTASQGSPQVVEWHGQRSDGSEFPSELTVACFRNPDGGEIAQFVVRDISAKVESARLRETMTSELERLVAERTEELRLEEAARRETENTLQEERNVLAALIERAPLGVMILDKSARLIRLNNWMKKAHELPEELCRKGTSYEELLNHIFLRKPEGTFGKVPVAEVLAARTERLKDEQDDTWEDLLPDGTCIRVERRFVEGLGFIITNTDITELKATQDDLVRQEKMAALGGLVAGVAHEVNTPVGICVTAASHLAQIAEDFRADLLRPQGGVSRKKVVERLERMSEGLDIVQRNLRRSADLIESFKLVAVDQTADDIRDFDLGDYVARTVQSLSAETRRRNLEIDLGSPAEPIPMKTYPGAVAQIVTNIVMNAAIHGYGDSGGVLETNITALPSGGARITFRDFGKGMDAETSRRIFDPFFTTRRSEGGTGLGMHIVFNLVTQRLGGSIRCRSDMGKGTEFEVDLP